MPRRVEPLLLFFTAPSTVGQRNTTAYLAIVGPNGCFLPNGSRRLAEITDAHGSTLMVIEAGEENAVPWMAPMDADEALVMGLGPDTKLHHAGGMNACFVDGQRGFPESQHSGPRASRVAVDCRQRQ